MAPILALLAALAALPASAASPYAGQESRELKALSPAEVADYLEGRGMGFARPAELNGYPGPMHVIELADGLELSAGQREATQRLLQAHKAEVRDLGRQLIEAEKALEGLFREGRATPDAVAAATSRAAGLQGRIRAAHLSTHLEQARLLSAAQVQRYGELRGYGDASPRPSTGHPGEGHPHRH